MSLLERGGEAFVFLCFLGLFLWNVVMPKILTEPLRTDRSMSLSANRLGFLLLFGGVLCSLVPRGVSPKIVLLFKRATNRERQAHEPLHKYRVNREHVVGWQQDSQ